MDTVAVKPAATDKSQESWEFCESEPWSSHEGILQLEAKTGHNNHMCLEQLLHFAWRRSVRSHDKFTAEIQRITWMIWMRTTPCGVCSWTSQFKLQFILVETKKRIHDLPRSNCKSSRNNHNKWLRSWLRIKQKLVVWPRLGNVEQVRFFPLVTFWLFFWPKPTFLRVSTVFMVENRPKFYPVTFWLFWGARLPSSDPSKCQAAQPSTTPNNPKPQNLTTLNPKQPWTQNNPTPWTTPNPKQPKTKTKNPTLGLIRVFLFRPATLNRKTRFNPKAGTKCFVVRFMADNVQRHCMGRARKHRKTWDEFCYSCELCSQILAWTLVILGTWIREEMVRNLLW